MHVRTQSFIFSIRKKIMRLKGLIIKYLHSAWFLDGTASILVNMKISVGSHTNSLSKFFVAAAIKLVKFSSL